MCSKTMYYKSDAGLKWFCVQNEENRYRDKMMRQFSTLQIRKMRILNDLCVLHRPQLTARQFVNHKTFRRNPHWFTPIRHMNKDCLVLTCKLCNTCNRWTRHGKHISYDNNFKSKSQKKFEDNIWKTAPLLKGSFSLTCYQQLITELTVAWF